MILHLRPACLALALAATAGPACAQSWVYEPDYGARAYYQPRVVYQERYVPRAYYNAYAYEPVVAAPVGPVRRTVVRRTVTERTVTVTETIRPRVVARRAVTEAYAWAPAPTRRVVTRPIAYDYGPRVTDAYAWEPAPVARVVTRPVLYNYGPQVTDAYAYAPLARPVVTVPVVQTYRYVNPLAVNPITGVFLSDE
jgi:hypothetical protein